MAATRSLMRSVRSLTESVRKSFDSCGCTPTVHQMSACVSAISRTAPKRSIRSQIVSMSPTPAARARAITASRSSSNWVAWRLTWLSISMGPEGSRPRCAAKLAERRPEGVAPVEVEPFDLAWQVGQRQRQLRPAPALARAFRRGRGGAGGGMVAEPFDEHREALGPLPAPKAVDHRLHGRGIRARQRSHDPPRGVVSSQTALFVLTQGAARRSVRHLGQPQRILVRKLAPAAEEVGHCLVRPGTEAEPPATRADGVQQRSGRMADQEEHAPLRRLLQYLQ